MKGVVKADEIRAEAGAEGVLIRAVGDEEVYIEVDEETARNAEKDIRNAVTQLVARGQ